MRRISWNQVMLLLALTCIGLNAQESPVNKETWISTKYCRPYNNLEVSFKTTWGETLEGKWLLNWNAWKSNCGRFFLPEDVTEWRMDLEIVPGEKHPCAIYPFEAPEEENKGIQCP